MPAVSAVAIGELADSIDGVVEAHLPQCFVPGVMASPAQVLVLIIDPAVDPEKVLNQMGQVLETILSETEGIDVWPMTRFNNVY
jgi:hypothetical protein